MLYELETGAPVEDVLARLLAEERQRDGRPWVLLNMVSSVDGATAVDGGSTALSDDDDRTLFHALRAVPDVILVGAGTVRAENYRPVRLPDESVDARVAVGLEPLPRLAIVSGRLNLDPKARVFSDPTKRPLLLTNESADPGQIERLSEVADVATLSSLEPKDVLGGLDGARVVLCEGGPTLNSQLMAAAVVDEVNWTVSPMLVAGNSKRIATGEPVKPPTEMRLTRSWRGERSLFLRYVTP